MLPIRNISYLLLMCCSFWEKCKNSPKTGLGCSTPLSFMYRAQHYIATAHAALGDTAQHPAVCLFCLICFVYWNHKKGISEFARRKWKTDNQEENEKQLTTNNQHTTWLILKLFNLICWGWPWSSFPSSHIFKSVSLSLSLHFRRPVGQHAYRVIG